MKIDWISKLQNLLQTIAFCLAIATIQYAFQPDRPYTPLVAYSLSTGCTIWAVIDLGRHLLPSASATGWPTGWQGTVLVAGGIVTGFFVGNVGGDAVMRSLGMLPAGTNNPGAHLRSALLITLLAGLAGSYWFYSRSKSAYLERRIGEAERHAGEARLKLLESQLEPHMLFNTLANLRALIGVDPARAQQMLDHMIAYLRATLDASRATTHPLQSEFDRLRDYLELMAIRMGPRLRYSLELPQGLANLPVPALLLQPVVENSILHGLEPKLEGGEVVVRAADEGGRLLLEVCDSGIGEAAASGGKGFGLLQVRERLAALHGTHATYEFTRDAQGARTRILLPIA
jgi:hypothetical protein